MFKFTSGHYTVSAGKLLRKTGVSGVCTLYSVSYFECMHIVQRFVFGTVSPEKFCPCLYGQDFFDIH